MQHVLMRIVQGTVLAAVVTIACPLGLPAARAAAIPTAIPDREFWRMVTELSEAGGVFASELMSNEDSAQFVIPELKARIGRGGVYLGVGPEQNFTYVAALQPRLAFVLDIRRDNLLQHLMYKALFELSSNRAEFLSQLFSRPRPSAVGAEASVSVLFEAFQGIEADAALHDGTLKRIISRLTGDHGFPLTESDIGGITRMMQTFRKAGPQGLKGSGDKNLTYVQAMTATDLAGNAQGYLASEANFAVVKDLQRRNLIVPVVGDFAGEKALPAIARYLIEQGAVVNVFYVSNVERYLYEQGDRRTRFYTNVAALPLEPSSTFIRSVTRDISLRLGFTLPDASGNWWSMLAPIRASLDAVTSGHITTYPQLFAPLPR